MALSSQWQVVGTGKEATSGLSTVVMYGNR